MGIGLLLLVVIVFGGSDDKKTSVPSPPAIPTAKAVDATTLYNSVAAVFVRRYDAVTTSHSRLSSESATFCGKRDGRSAFACEMRVDVPLFSDESWLYDISVGAAGCWTAHTRARYGANQELIDAYRNREALAPSRADVRRYVRESDRLHSLRGCQSNVQRAEGGSPQEFIAAHAAQDVQRERPGRQLATTCDYNGKTVVALAPDSYDFECTTKMASGRAFDDKISCFDPPPYTSFDSCSEDQGYPKRPPRPLP